MRIPFSTLALMHMEWGVFAQVSKIPGGKNVNKEQWHAQSGSICGGYDCITL